MVTRRRRPLSDSSAGFPVGDDAAGGGPGAAGGRPCRVGARRRWLTRREQHAIHAEQEERSRRGRCRWRAERQPRSSRMNRPAQQNATMTPVLRHRCVRHVSRLRCMVSLSSTDRKALCGAVDVPDGESAAFGVRGWCCCCCVPMCLCELRINVMCGSEDAAPQIRRRSAGVPHPFRARSAPVPSPFRTRSEPVPRRAEILPGFSWRCAKKCNVL